MSPTVKAVLYYHILLIVLMGVLSSGVYILPFDECEKIARGVFGLSIVAIVVMNMIALHKAISVKGERNG